VQKMAKKYNFFNGMMHFEEMTENIADKRGVYALSAVLLRFCFLRSRTESRNGENHTLENEQNQRDGPARRPRFEVGARRRQRVNG
jgi:hypothetical protein